MLRKPTPTITIKVDGENIRSQKAEGHKIYSVTITATNLDVTLAFRDELGTALDVREYYIRDNPELASIVEFSTFDDVWDMELILNLLDNVSEDEPAGVLTQEAIEVLKVAS